MSDNSIHFDDWKNSTSSFQKGVVVEFSQFLKGVWDGIKRGWTEVKVWEILRSPI